MMWEVAFDVRCELGEGPIYDEQEDALIWFDIIGQKLFIASLANQHITQHTFDEPVSAAFLGNAGALFMAGASGLYHVHRTSGEAVLIQPIEADKPETRANDSRTGPGGSIWYGTMGRKLEAGAGAVYHLKAEADKGWKNINMQTLFSGVSIPNATCFAADGKTAYFCDTPRQQIMQIPIDPKTGLPIANPSVFVDLAPERLNPDGAVVDEEGCVWNAQWGAGQIACYGPDGRFRKRIELPASQITCPCFGGKDFKTLFVTSAYEGLDRQAEPLAGAVFAIEMEVAGLPERRTNLAL
ncbi:SMP-30/gluconolactonase/LRE family protein [Alphaproteobacteria bacterium]|nr:SMP-30/gluconolactonase/LRE family protein [Alphaproteobacteria bacterium]